jgi:CheY-like chemotaxis protein
MRILIIDDEAIIAKALGRAFEKRGHEVFLAGSGEEGLRLWEKHRPHLLLIDVMMPGMTGPQVLEERRKLAGGLMDEKVLFMSAHSNIKTDEFAVELGAHGFIPKPFVNVFDLVARCEKLIALEP